jgi:hypothetical protein
MVVVLVASLCVREESRLSAGRNPPALVHPFEIVRLFVKCQPSPAPYHGLA